MLINIVKIIEYTRCWRVQPGVAERSDADDRLRRALITKLSNMFTKNIVYHILLYIVQRPSVLCVT